ncbi:peptidylprolyl isomerase [Deferribacter thermophilus]|uniref:peptidylprolyl isomerase n=1 Tax=Deferribacter thermophilus TaxID=53573 RepID=UPI003C19CAA7
MKKSIILGFLLVIFIASLAFAEDKIVAKVNGKAIYESEVNTIITELLLNNGIAPSSVDFNNPQLVEIKKKILEQLIDREVLAQHSETFTYKGIENDVNKKLDELKSGFKTDKEYKDALQKNNLTEEGLKEKIKKNILVKKHIDSFKDKISINDLEKKNYYDKNKEKFVIKDSVHVKHIVILTGDKRSDDEAKKLIENIYSELQKGANFEDLAKEYSEDGSAKMGGDLGYIAKGKVVPEFEKVAFETEVGKISKPFKSRFGYHILKVLDKKKGKQLSFDEVKEQITKVLFDQKLETIIKTNIDNWKKQDKIERFL